MNGVACCYIRGAVLSGGGSASGFADTSGCGAEARVDVDERIARTEDRTKILARNQFAGTAHEKAQDLPGLLLQSDSASLLG